MRVNPSLARGPAKTMVAPYRDLHPSLTVISIGGFMPTLASVIHSDPDIHSGTPVFVGTRVSFQNLIDCLAAGDSLEKFLDAFPSLTREQATAAVA